MTYTLPLPPAINRMYRTTRFGGFYKTSEAKEWLRVAQLLLLQSKPQEPVTGLEITFYYKDARSDIDGRLKACLDALQGALYENDRQLTDLVLHKRIDKDNPRVEITIL